MSAPEGTADAAPSDEVRVQERAWRWQRPGWAALAMVPLLAMAGLFGGGPLAQVRSEGAGGASLEYERFVRLDSPVQLRVTVPVRARADGVVRVAIERELTRELFLEERSPEPSRTEAGARATVYEYDVPDRATRADVAFRMRAQRVGLVRFELRAGDDRFRAWMFVFP